MQTKITHLTSAHGRYDTRIFLKMCSSLAKIDNYSVSLIVADGMGKESKNGVCIIDIGEKTGNRIHRMTKIVKKIFDKAIELDSDFYHIHDPELIPIGLKLKKLGKIVVFDAHEDLPKQLMGKSYLPVFTRVFFSIMFRFYEMLTCKKFDAIIAATPFIRDKFLKLNKNSFDINNFPVLGELLNVSPWIEKKNEICYVGGITQIRGIKEVVRALEFTRDLKLNLVGSFSEKTVEAEVKSYNGWQKVNEFGFLDRVGVAHIMNQSKAGIVTFHPTPNHTDAQPNKMFEYMSAGIPIVVSNFPLWKEIVVGNNCGLYVDPLEPKEIAKAIDYIINHPTEAEQMGQNGKKAVFDKYNWHFEEKKLFDIYKDLIK
jgi:glycosyltransferase involved in cell wall biosynthesis